MNKTASSVFPEIVLKLESCALSVISLALAVKRGAGIKRNTFPRLHTPDGPGRKPHRLGGRRPAWNLPWSPCCSSDSVESG